jgi:hypothetical protein
MNRRNLEEPAMPVDDPKDLKRIDQEIRLNELKAQAEELAGGEMTSWESPDCPPEIAEQFWQNVVDFEKSEGTSHFQLLLDRGVELPAPIDLNDEQLGGKLAEVIAELATMNVYLCSTDHLNDRQLYELLWSDVLHEWTPESTPPGMNCHLDLVSGGSAEDIVNWLRFYADDESRAHWQQSFPEEEMLPRAKPPFDRDRHLPKPARE